MFDFRKTLFSMVVKCNGIRPPVTPGAPPDYLKHTMYTIDARFQQHLKICGQCRDQLVSGLLETARSIQNGENW